MSIFNKAIQLSKKIGQSILKNELSIDLEQSDFFEKIDKKYILDNLKEPELIEKRLLLKKSINKAEGWKKVESRIKGPVRYLYCRKYAATAAVFVILLSGYVFRGVFISDNQKDAEIIIESIIKPGTDKAILTTADGSLVELVKGKSLKTKNATTDGRVLVYEKNNSNLSKLAYNFLTVPRGGQFLINLQDGTKVWLNSESQLKYPVSFEDGLDRRVELIYGEAYFDVSPSENHGGSKFKVANQNQEIEVLGTEFNIKAYKDETNIYTTLVEGKVLVKKGNTLNQLTPNQMSNFDLTKNTITLTTVDVYNEISWKEGIFSFDGKTLKDIMTVLSRWYDFEVEFRDKSIEEEEFVGILEKGQDIEDILRSIKSFEIIGDYSIEGKLIILE